MERSMLKIKSAPSDNKFIITCTKQDYQKGEPILKDTFFTQNQNRWNLFLFANGLIIQAQNSHSIKDNVKIITFSKSCYFETIHKKTYQDQVFEGLRFADCLVLGNSETFYTDSSITFRNWNDVLSKYLNQRGFESQFELLNLIGKGNFAKVYLGKNKNTNNLFAIKILQKQTKNLRSQEAFLKQIQMLRLLNHPNILKLYGAFIQQNALYAITEYFQHDTLFQEITTKQSYTKSEQFKIISNLLNAVDYLRSKRIVHRDLKLENIFIKKTINQQTYVLGDFGLAAYIDQKNHLFQACGTVGYAAPQILRHQKGKKFQLSSKIDTFSLGAIFHLVFLKRTVFRYTNGNINELTNLNKKCYINWRQQFYRKMPKQQLEILQCMLTENPQNRFTTKEILKLPYFSKLQKLYQKSNDTSDVNSISCQSTFVDDSFGKSCNSIFDQQSVDLQNQSSRNDFQKNGTEKKIKKNKGIWNFLKWFQKDTQQQIAVKKIKNNHKSEDCFIEEPRRNKQRFSQDL